MRPPRSVSISGHRGESPMCPQSSRRISLTPLIAANVSGRCRPRSVPPRSGPIRAPHQRVQATQERAAAAPTPCGVWRMPSRAHKRRAGPPGRWLASASSSSVARHSWMNCTVPIPHQSHCPNALLVRLEIHIRRLKSTSVHSQAVEQALQSRTPRSRTSAPWRPPCIAPTPLPSGGGRGWAAGARRLEQSRSRLSPPPPLGSPL